MRRKTILAGIAGCVLLTAPVGSTTSPVALTSAPEISDPAAATLGLDDEPVVVRAGSDARGWSAAGARTAGLTPAQVDGAVLDAYATAVALAPESCRITVPVLAAIGQVESGNLAGSELDAGHRVTPALVGPRLDGGAFKAVTDTDDGALDGDKRFDRAVGPMQFLPETWRSVAVDIDGDGERDPQDVYDAAGGAMVYLCNGRDLSDPAQLREAVLAYNRSADYLAQVLAWKETYEREGLVRETTGPVFAAFELPTATFVPQAGSARTLQDLPVGKPVRPAADAAPTKRPADGPTAQPSGKPGSAPAPVDDPAKPGKPTLTPIVSPTPPAGPGASPPAKPEGPVTPTDPAPTDPAPTDPAPTDPAPTEPPAPEPVLLASVELFDDLAPCGPDNIAGNGVTEDLFATLVYTDEDQVAVEFADGTSLFTDGTAETTVDTLCASPAE